MDHVAKSSTILKEHPKFCVKAERKLKMQQFEKALYKSEYTLETRMKTSISSKAFDKKTES